MKNLITSILFFISLSASGQFSDFFFDSCAFANSLTIRHIQIDSTDWIFDCDNDNHYNLHEGDNKMLPFSTHTVNGGQHDFDFANALDPSGLYFDSCHWHWHLAEWAMVRIYTREGDTTAFYSKIGWNLTDSYNYMLYLQNNPGGCSDAWINQYGTPDYALALHPRRFDYTIMGISAGWGDIYGASTYGNSINIDTLSDGYYWVELKGNFSRYVNQGLNLWPDVFRVPVLIQGDNLTVLTEMPPLCQVAAPVAPVNITLSRTNLLGWDLVPEADSYSVYSQMAYQDHGWQWYAPTEIATGIRGNRFQLPTLPNTFWRFYVKATNCAGDSPLSEPSKKDKQ